MTIIAIMVGGALGSLLRYSTGVWLQAVTAGSALATFPLATLIVNILGSFLLSLVASLGLQGIISPGLRIALGTGFVGAFTTFSTFQMESDLLLREGQSWAFTLYVVGNLVLGYLALLLGRAVASRLGLGYFVG